MYAFPSSAVPAATRQQRERDGGVSRRIVIDTQRPLLERGKPLVEPGRQHRIRPDDLVYERVRELVPDDREVAVGWDVLQVDGNGAIARKGDAPVRRGEQSGIGRPRAEQPLKPGREADPGREDVDRRTASERSPVVALELLGVTIDRARDPCAIRARDRRLDEEICARGANGDHVAAGALADPLDRGRLARSRAGEREVQRTDGRQEPRELAGGGCAAGTRPGRAGRTHVGRECEGAAEREPDRQALPWGDASGRERATDPVTLSEFAAELRDEVPRRRVLDADGDDRETEIVRDLDERPRVVERRGLSREPSYERSGELELVDASGERTSGHVRGRDTIEGKTRAGRGEAAERAAHIGDGQERGGADVEREHARLDVKRAERLDGVADHAGVGELGAGHIDRDAQNEPPFAPGDPLAHRLGDHPAAQGADLARVLRDGDQLGGRDGRSAPAPPEQRLDATALAAPQVDDRLIAKEQLVARERASEVRAETTRLDRRRRGPALRAVGARERLDDARPRRAFHAVAVSCRRATRSCSPVSRRCWKMSTSSASHCFPAPDRSRERASSQLSPAR